MEFAVIIAKQDLEYASARLVGENRERHAADVDVATRSLGRLVAWVKFVNTDSSQRQVHLPQNWMEDVTKTANLMRKIVGLAPGGWISDVVGGELVKPDATRPDRSETQLKLNRWNHSSLDTIEAVRRWMTNNWIAFIGATSKNPRLSWDVGLFDQTASNMVGNLLTALGEKMIKKGSAALAGALIGSAAGPVGTVIGFVIGLMIETIASIAYDYLFGDKGEKEDKAARDAAKRTGTMAEAKHEEFSRAADVAREQQTRAFDAVQDNVNTANSKTKLDAIARDLERDTPAVDGPRRPGDKSLYRAMLRDWVLENAGDEEDANKETSEAQWEAALEETFGKGTDELKNQRDLFAYQTRSEWIKAGFNPIEVRRVTDGMISAVARPKGDGQKLFDGQVFKLPVLTSAPELRNYLARNTKAISEEDMVGIEKDPAKNLKATCELDSAKSDGTTYVDEWNYVFSLPARPAHYRSHKAAFDVEPD